MKEERKTEMRKNPVHFCLLIEFQDFLPGKVKILVVVSEEKVLWVWAGGSECQVQTMKST